MISEPPWFQINPLIAYRAKGATMPLKRYVAFSELVVPLGKTESFGLKRSQFFDISSLVLVSSFTKVNCSPSTFGSPQGWARRMRITFLPSCNTLGEKCMIHFCYNFATFLKQFPMALGWAQGAFFQYFVCS